MLLARLPDGRDLEYESLGPESAPVVLFHHGMPGSAVPMDTVLAPVLERGFRVVTYSRPGYGRSTPVPGRTVAETAADCARLIDHLGIARYCGFGWSGGGPHALASAAVDAHRVSGVLISASFAPPTAPGLDFVAGMGEQNGIQFRSLQEGDRAARAVVSRMAAAVRGNRPEDVTAQLSSLFPDVDVSVMTSGFGADNAANMDHALEAGNEGWLADLKALGGDWGFDLADVVAPVELWHGELDRMVPVAHGEWLSRNLTDVRAHLEPDHGHVSLTVQKVGSMLDALTSRLNR
ncbi:alpha/beta fold hydrolase [Actinomadura rugatobispora]|uniref:Alpha/beta fold hydrolase n=1 Tax=Actinomadura rugatobispora TaxID=1994 RepID=A0ABW0ZN40_9ACTN|nr:alpha/beta hydrolase [Actinomadura rugatobispora]